MTQRTELDELREIARLATCEALKAFVPISATWRANLALGTFVENDVAIFELYIAAERPEDAIVISAARVNRKTRAVAVTISNLPKFD